MSAAIVNSELIQISNIALDIKRGVFNCLAGELPMEVKQTT